MKVVKLFAATKAFINYRGRILIVREALKYTDGANIGRYDVVGGRIKPGQNFNVSLLREIREETGLTVKLGNPFYVGEWRPKVRGEQWQIVGIFFECFSKTNKVKLSEDHDEYLWIEPKKYKKYKLIDNLKPAFESYFDK